MPAYNCEHFLAPSIDSVIAQTYGDGELTAVDDASSDATLTIAEVGCPQLNEVQLRTREKLAWLRRYLRLKHGIPAHDTFRRIFGLIDPAQFEGAFRRWVSSILPALGGETVAIDGKTSQCSGGVDATALHLVSAFAATSDSYRPELLGLKS